MRKSSTGLLVLASSMCLGLTPLPAKDAPEEEARHLVGSFMQALKASDLDGLLAVVDVPWFHDGKRILNDRADLKAEFKQLLEKKKDLSALTFDIKQLTPYRTLRPKTNVEERKLLDEVITPDDYVALLRVEVKTKVEHVVLAIRRRDCVVKIVGIKN